jgi:putative methionine-R-sulfoxide reductase with GAF domain
VTDHEKKPLLDEHAFEKLLEAAYVLQEHSRRRREVEEKVESASERLREQDAAHQAPPPINKAESQKTFRQSNDYTLTLAEIVEAQHQIQMRRLELDKAMALVAERVARITGSSGAAIAILEGSTVHYRAGSGTPALPLGSEAPVSKAVCTASLRTGQVIRSEDVNSEFLFDPELCRQRGIASLVVVPIYREDEIVGALELYFDKVRGFAEQDIHTCQLMAGLVTEAIGRDAELTLKKSMAEERSSMLAAIERLQPNLVAWAEGQTTAASNPSAGASTPITAKSLCWKCGNKLLVEEQFCGKCGAPRASDGGPSSMQSKLASAWQMQQAGQDSFPAMPSSGILPSTEMARPLTPRDSKNKAGHEEQTADVNLPQLISLPKLELNNLLSETSVAASAAQHATAAPLRPQSQFDDDVVEAASTAPFAQPQGEEIVWSSAAKARHFLESLSAKHAPGTLARLWRSRRGDFYLVVAVILVVLVIRWGIWSNHSVGATGRGTAASGSVNRSKQPAPDADLSAFDKLLISLGLAEPPEAPEYRGNPDTQVWVDLHTALYYCPGSDLYGKTPQGKITSQRDAQLDQFEPANRKACD